ncbi:hypothetical protein OPQ81_004667 [Rhizoctonia solani]|nr:hypothetical protein OPQ81_004667 [Rhizoctonia solani]
MILPQFAARIIRARAFTTAPSLPKVYVSLSNDPYFNLSYEEWLFRHTDPTLPILFMYRNKESVIIGRNQNPWKEINQTSLRESGIEFVRRRSGGRDGVPRFREHKLQRDGYWHPRICERAARHCCAWEKGIRFGVQNHQ